MNATDRFPRDSATLRATVDFPDPDPPAIPMIKGFTLKTEDSLTWTNSPVVIDLCHSQQTSCIFMS